MKLIAVEVSIELRNSRVPISPQSYAKCQNRIFFVFSTLSCVVHQSRHCCCCRRHRHQVIICPVFFRWNLVVINLGDKSESKVNSLRGILGESWCGYVHVFNALVRVSPPALSSYHNKYSAHLPHSMDSMDSTDDWSCLPPIGRPAWLINHPCHYYASTYISRSKTIPPLKKNCFVVFLSCIALWSLRNVYFLDHRRRKYPLLSSQ